MLHIDRIAEAVTTPPVGLPPFRPEPGHASVALLLTGPARALELCFILRAERAGDPWSGQVALPGGRAGPGDPDPAAVAERETAEEIGLEVARGCLVGPLPPHHVDRGPPRRLTLTPFVYYLGREPSSVWPTRANHEVADVFWVRLPELFDPARVTRLEWPPGTGGAFPGIRVGPHVIWGLTLRVLQSFAERLGLGLPALGGAGLPEGRGEAGGRREGRAGA